MDIARRSTITLFAIFVMLFAPAAAAPEGQHDFDFEFGAWHAHVSRLLHPLSGSHVWTQYSGTSVVRKIWGGRGDIGELDVRGPAGRIRGMTLRLYNPRSAQWRIYWANSNDGTLTTPLVGAFKNGQGEFSDKETFNGRPIVARFIFSNFTPRTFRITQSFSDDAGNTWEANWIADFTR